MDLAFGYDTGLQILRGSQELNMESDVMRGIYTLTKVCIDFGKKPTEENQQVLREKIKEVELSFENYRMFMDGVVKEVINGSEELTASRSLYGNNK